MHETLTDYPDTPLRPVLTGLLDDDEQARASAFDDLREMREYAPGEREALRLLDVVSSAEWNDWRRPEESLLRLLWNAPHLALVEPAREAFIRAIEHGDDDGAIRLALLTLLASTRTRAGLEVFADLVREHGWPPQVYPRVFMELSGNERHAGLIFPALLELSDQYLVDVGGIALRWLQSETITPDIFVGLVPQLVSRLHALLDRARGFEKEGIAWKFDEEYASIRARAGFLLDFVGWFDAPEVVTALERSTESADPWLALFGVTSLLRLGHEVPDDVLEVVAASHETRGHLWQYLENLGELHRYPNEWANLEDFAAFDMVQWLKYPTELGHEPDELELMATFEGVSEADPVVLCVWRFSGWDGDSLAAVSGPYRTDTVGPMAGSSTFSRFEAWDSRTAEEHAEAVLDTLDTWTPEA